jgi:hypothetical protein
MAMATSRTILIARSELREHSRWHRDKDRMAGVDPKKILQKMVERSGFGLPVPIREQSDDKHSVYGISLRYEGACAGSSFRTIFRRMHIIGDCVAEQDEFEYSVPLV